MGDRRHTADGESGFRAHEICVRLARVNSSQIFHLADIDAPVTGTHDQNRLISFPVTKNQRIGDLTHGATERIGGQLRGSHGVRQNPDVELEFHRLEVLLYFEVSGFHQ